MRTHLLSITCYSLIILSMASPAVQAQSLIEQRWPEKGYYHINGSGVSLDDAVQMAQSRYRAKVVKAETVRSGDRRVHQIRLLNSEGKVWTVRIDAETGQMY